MKTLSYLIALSMIITFLGCKNQQKSKVEQTASKYEELVFGDKKVTYFIEGKGDPCIVSADGILQAKCLSENLKKNFQFIFTEPRHSTHYEEPKDYSGISMDTIIDDIEILRKNLNYEKIYVLGHSICGLIALEYARKYPQNTYGVIMINTPPNFPDDYFDIVSRNWEANASAERKIVYNNNKKTLSKMNIDSLPEIEKTFLHYKSNVPMQWHDSLYDITSIFRNYRENTEGWNHFFAFMKDYDIARSEIIVPIFLSLGSYDFIMPQSLWDDFIYKFSTLTVKRFQKSGHYPHVEEQEIFDKELLTWTKTK